jgi:hypothetical protein
MLDEFEGSDEKLLRWWVCCEKLASAIWHAARVSAAAFKSRSGESRRRSLTDLSSLSYLNRDLKFINYQKKYGKIT